MFYHTQCNLTIHDFKMDYITKEAALNRLQIIEKKAYNRIPSAELDGDITYAVACAVEEIDKIEAANHPIQLTTKRGS